ncbi:MAG: Nucleoid-associated protein YbaB [Chlamydiae bacterium]|nr:Nucleoid-associated protein YbaB [Chlamydiota bacterium]
MGSGFKKRKKQMQVLQEQLMQAQEEIKNKQVVGTSGGGLVSVTLSGEHEMLDVSIKKECIDPEDQDGLQDLIRSAYSDACKQLKDSEPDMSGSSLFDLMPS